MNAFKGTLTSLEVNEIIEKYLLSKGHRVKCVPISDGGDGFLDAISSVVHGKVVRVETVNALGDSMIAPYLLAKDCAYIELAKSSGLNLVDTKMRNPLKTSTYGTGLLVNDAIQKGARKIVIGIGGSATNDGGAGMLQAMGVKFYQGKSLIEDMLNGENIAHITDIDDNDMKARMSHVEFEVISDVTNPLLGDQGSAHIYAAQKGANDQEIFMLEKHMKHYAEIVENNTHKLIKHIEGAGAAGGVGFGLLSFMNARILSGSTYMIERLDIKNLIDQTDLVIVGEGKLDEQTLFGKAPSVIATLAKQYHKKTIGIFALKNSIIYPDFLDEFHVIVPKYASEKESVAHPKKSLLNLIQNLF